MVLGSTCRFLPHTVKSFHCSFHTNNMAGNQSDEISINESVWINRFGLVEIWISYHVKWHVELVELADQAVNSMELSAIHGYLFIFASLLVCDGQSHDSQKYTMSKTFSRKTSPFLFNLSVLLVGNTYMVCHVDHIPRMHCHGDYCAIWCYTNMLSRVLRIVTDKTYFIDQESDGNLTWRNSSSWSDH